MKYQVLSLLAIVAGSVSAQGVTDKISPTRPTPPECTSSLDGNFQIIISESLGNAKRATHIVSQSMIANLFPTLTSSRTSDSKDLATRLASSWDN